jgi:hypothetical protein
MSNKVDGQHSVSDIVSIRKAVRDAAASSATMVSKGVNVGLGFTSCVAVASLPENAKGTGEKVCPFAGNLLAVVVPAVVVDAVDDVDEGA